MTCRSARHILTEWGRVLCDQLIRTAQIMRVSSRRGMCGRAGAAARPSAPRPARSIPLDPEPHVGDRSRDHQDPRLGARSRDSGRAPGRASSRSWRRSATSTRSPSTELPRGAGAHPGEHGRIYLLAGCREWPGAPREATRAPGPGPDREERERRDADGGTRRRSSRWTSIGTRCSTPTDRRWARRSPRENTSVRSGSVGSPAAPRGGLLHFLHRPGSRP